MLVSWVTEVMYIELVVPISHHGLVVIRPALSIGFRRMLAVGPQYLDVVDADHRTETAVMPIGIAQRRTRIMHLLGIEQTVEDSFVCLEDGTMLV